MSGKNQIFHNIYYTVLKSDFNGTLKFLIGNNNVAIFGVYEYNEIHGGMIRLTVLENPLIISNNYKTYVESNIISYNDFKIGDLNYEYFMDVNFLISLYKRYRNLECDRKPYTQRLIIENNIKIINFNISFFELVVSKKLIPLDEICQLSQTYSGLEELILIYY